MSHHCGLVFENILQRDEGIWKCKMNLKDQYSNTQSFKKVIDLKVNKRKRRGDTHFGYSGGYANVEFGSGDGSGDDEPSYDKSNKLRNRRRKRNKRKRHGGKEFGFFGGYASDGFGSGYGSGFEPDYEAGVLLRNFQTEVYCLRSIILALEVYFLAPYQYNLAIFIVVFAIQMP